jgi:hypothetical protein
MLSRERIVYSENNTKDINTLWTELLIVKAGGA